MKLRKQILTFLLAVVVLVSCKKDDEANTLILSPTIDDADYTGGGTLKFMYSTDNGATYQSSMPKLNSGDVLLVKLNNETEDLSGDDYIFDWSNSSLDPEDVTAPVAKFNITKTNFQIYVIVDDKLLLVTSHRNTGVFYSLDTATGAKTELFTPKYTGAAIPGLRGFVYHAPKNRFYASTSSTEGGTIFEIDPATKAATIINDNNSGTDPEWYAISNFVVLPDDSLMGIGWLKSPEVNTLMKFNTEGNKSPRHFPVGLCCGLAMMYNTNTEELTVSDEPDNGSMRLVRLKVDGNVVDTRNIYDLRSFPADVSSDWMPTRALVQNKEGKTFAIMYNNDTKQTYLVKVDMSIPAVTYVTTLGADVNNQYNSLAFIPKHSL